MVIEEDQIDSVLCKLDSESTAAYVKGPTDNKIQNTASLPQTEIHFRGGEKDTFGGLHPTDRPPFRLPHDNQRKGEISGDERRYCEKLKKGPRANGSEKEIYFSSPPFLREIARKQIRQHGARKRQKKIVQTKEQTAQFFLFFKAPICTERKGLLF